MGNNFGRADTPDYALWTPDERAVGMFLGNTPGAEPLRYGGGAERPFIQSSFATNGMLVGRSNITVVVAGQRATLPAEDPLAPVIACAAGYTGKPGQTW